MPKECALHSAIGVHAQSDIGIYLSKVAINVHGIVASSRITVVAAHEHFVQASNHPVTEVLLYLLKTQMVFEIFSKCRINFSGTHGTRSLANIRGFNV